MTDFLTNELEPCPFCGGEVIHEINGTTGLYVCNKSGCYAEFKFPQDFSRADNPLRKEESERRWNTRYKPTCHNISTYKPKLGTFDTGGHFVCSECGFAYSFAELPYRLCPECGAELCGAEVVDG